MNCNHRILFLLGGLLLLVPLFLNGQTVSSSSEDFSFAIIADPQVSARDSKSRVARNSQHNLEQACNEINGMAPQPDFTVFLGDLCNVFEPRSVDNFRESIKKLETPLYLVHGNHDTKPPYEKFIALHKEYNPHITSVYYAFEHKGWFFVALPCVKELDREVMEWLDRELASHREMPTVVFEHFHLIPNGLSQLEFYSFDIAQRGELLDLLARYGNVRYYFNGHVHNGVKASVKISRRYRGIDFVTVPTIISVRPFGEEYAGFTNPDDGGFYLIAQTAGDSLKLEGRKAGCSYSHVYPELATFNENTEPRWLKTIGAISPESVWSNGDFSRGLDGWFVKERYQRDSIPAFSACVEQVSGHPMLHLSVTASEPADWADDEYLEVWRMVQVEPGKPVRLYANYRIGNFHNGGGFIRATAFDQDNNPILFMFHWGEQEAQASYLPRCFGFELKGKATSWNFLRDAGRTGKAFYVRIGNSSSEKQVLNADLSAIYDESVGRPGAFKALGIVKLYVGVGVWINKESGSKSDALFSDIYAGTDNDQLPRISAAQRLQATSHSDFGKALDMRVRSRAARTNTNKQ